VQGRDRACADLENPSPPRRDDDLFSGVAGRQAGLEPAGAATHACAGWDRRWLRGEQWLDDDAAGRARCDAKLALGRVQEVQDAPHAAGGGQAHEESQSTQHGCYRSNHRTPLRVPMSRICTRVGGPRRRQQTPARYAGPMPDLMQSRVVLALPGIDEVAVERGERLDIYKPAGDDWRRPAVVFARGWPDPAGTFKQLPPFTSWARLVAAAGLVGVLYSGELDDAVHELARHPAVDPERIALFACSGHGPTALAQIARGNIARAALVYPYTLDVRPSLDVADAAARFGFATPPVGELPAIPLLVVRAGADDMPGLNASLDRFVTTALARDLPLTVINVPGAPHAFDLAVVTDGTRDVVRAVIAFLARAGGSSATT
jgi:hypothetical protein